MDYKIILENWRRFSKKLIQEQEGNYDYAKYMIMQLDDVLSFDDELSGIMIKKIFHRAKKYALQSIDLEIPFPKVKFPKGTGRPGSRYTAWASYYARRNTIYFWTGTWEFKTKDIKGFLKNIILSLYEQRNRDNFQKMSLPAEETGNLLEEKEIQKIKSLILEIAAIILSFTLIHELEHANQNIKYGPYNWDNPSFTAVYEYDASDREEMHMENMRPIISKLSDNLSYMVYLIMLRFGMDQEIIENYYKNIRNSIKDEVVNMANAIDSWKQYYDSPVVPDEYDIKSDKKYVALYTVKKGDNLYKISKKFGVDFADILKLNRQLKDPNKIYPGQRIRIPNSPGLPNVSKKKNLPVAGVKPGNQAG